MKYAKILKFGLLLALVPFLASADFFANNWQYQKKINLGEFAGEGYVQFKVDREMYEHSPLSDIRIIDASNAEIPYQLVTRDTSYTSDSFPVKIINTSTDSLGRRLFIVNFGRDGQIHNKIDLDISNPNFKRKVHIFASDSLLSLESDSWRNITDNGYIFKFTDSTTGFSTGQTSVYYPDTTSSYLKFVIDTGEEGPLSVTNANIVRQLKKVEIQDVFDVNATISEDTVVHNTEIVADFGSIGVPTNVLTLDFLSDNFDRQALVMASDDKYNWRDVGQGHLFSTNTTSYVGKNSEISYPETQARYYKVIIFNGDNTPIKLSSVLTLKGISRSVIFKGQSENQFKVFYGNPSARIPRYDLAKFFQYIETENIPLVSLGSENLNEKYTKPLPPVVPFTERYPYLLNSVLFVLILVIVIFVFLFVRKQKISISNPTDTQVPETPSDESSKIN